MIAVLEALTRIIISLEILRNRASLRLSDRKNGKSWKIQLSLIAGLPRLSAINSGLGTWLVTSKLLSLAVLSYIIL